MQASWYFSKGFTLRAPCPRIAPSQQSPLRSEDSVLPLQNATRNTHISDLETLFRRSINQPDQLHILATVENSFKNHFLKQKKIQIRKFLVHKILHQATVNSKSILWSEKFVCKLSEYVLTETEGSVWRWGSILQCLIWTCSMHGWICKVQTSPRLGHGLLLED